MSPTARSLAASSRSTEHARHALTRRPQRCVTRAREVAPHRSAWSGGAQILLHVTEAAGWVLRDRLVNGPLDIAMLFVGHPERGLAVEPLLLEELFYVTADPDTSPIRIADAAKRPLLASARSANSRHVFEEALKKHGLTVTPIGEIDTMSPLRQAIALGIGNAIMPWSALCDDEGKIALNYRRFADAEMIRPVALCFSEVSQRTPAVNAVAEILKSLVRELVERGIWQGVSLIAPAAELSGLSSRHENSELDIPRLRQA